MIGGLGGRTTSLWTKSCSTTNGNDEGFARDMKRVKSFSLIQQLHGIVVVWPAMPLHPISVSNLDDSQQRSETHANNFIMIGILSRGLNTEMELFGWFTRIGLITT